MKSTSSGGQQLAAALRDASGAGGQCDAGKTASSPRRSADFTRNQKRGLHLRAGQELTHFNLMPGEEVRGPLIVLQFWKGDWLLATSLFQGRFVNSQDSWSERS
jgi:hypothetical protein